MNRLKGKVIFVTGAASGIGQATALAVRDAGGIVAATDICPIDGLGPEDMALDLDVRDVGQTEAVVAKVVSRFGRIDGLAACAGIATQGAVTQFALDTWERTLAVNLTGTMLACRAVLPHMVSAGCGSIVAISSIYGMTGGPGNTAYNVSKGGILQLVRSMAADFGAAGIRVNAVSPGYIETPMTHMLDHAHDVRDAFIAMHLLRRPGTAQEVAQVIRFLLSDESSFVTGANIPVDGGFSSAQVIQG